MRVSLVGQLLALPVLQLTVGGCELPWTEVDEGPVSASVTVVLTGNPADSSWVATDALALLTRDAPDPQVPGASVRIAGKSGQSLQLAEILADDPACQSDSTARTWAGTCYMASAPSAHFAPGEELSLRTVTRNGRILTGVSTMPDSFLPSGITVSDGRCRMNPDTNYDIRWESVTRAWAFIAGARFARLPRSLWPYGDDLYLRTAWLASAGARSMVFPRALVGGGVEERARKAARALETGLPWRVTADLAVAAVDRNWANWIRPGRYDPNGEVRIPSVFGDGTGMFGTGVRWTVTLESRDSGDETGLVDCGLEEET